MMDMEFYALHHADCGWEPGYQRADGITQPCRCGLLALLAGQPVPGAPLARVDALRAYACHTASCAWSQSIYRGEPEAACTCGLDELRARLGPSKYPATRAREAAAGIVLGRVFPPVTG